MNAYKVQLVQELKPHDHLMRFRFAQWAEDRLIEDEHFYRKIIFSDEAHFHLGGYVNKQNCRIWGSENPHVIVEKPMHPQRVTVWCGFWSGGIIGPFFFENEQGNAVTVSGDRYRAMLSNFLFPKIEEDDIDDIWFQQDGATCHTANVTIDLLRTVFENRIISRNADVNWPPRSCDLTPLDFFLWGAVKDKCYAKHPETIDDLKHEIEVAIDEIEAQTIENVLKNWTDRMEYCKASRGSHLNDVVFHS
ncbi:Transposable element Tc3 transposase [Anthophora plagiata]